MIIVITKNIYIHIFTNMKVAWTIDNKEMKSVHMGG